MILATFTINAGWHDRHGCPVKTTVALPKDTNLNRLYLRDDTSQTDIPVQAWPTDDGQVTLAWIITDMRQGQAQIFSLRLSEIDHANVVQLQDNDANTMNIVIGDKHFTTYNFGAHLARPYLYPVRASDGVGITRNWPMIADAQGDTTDHIHHKGIWTAHGEVNGTVDNWGESEGHGWQIHRRFSRRFEGPVAGGFTQQLDWTDAQKHTNMTETRHMTFYGISNAIRLFDYNVTLTASEGDVLLADTKEAGLLSVRVATSMDAKNEEGGIIVNGHGGIQEAETWGKRAPWCHYSGPIRDKTYGICLMDHSDNPRFPAHWHVRNYGLMTANCFGLHDFTRNPDNRWDLVIPAGKSMTWRYRVLIHDGNSEQGQITSHYQNFVHPPIVEHVV